MGNIHRVKNKIWNLSQRLSFFIRRYAAVLFSGFLFLLAFAYALKWVELDEKVLMILAGAIVVALVPWRMLRSLKAGPFEISIDTPQIRNVLDRIEVDEIEDRALRRIIEDHASTLAAIAGSKILWIDDRPEEIVGQRRLLKALRLDVVTATNSDTAERLLIENPDFDLIISDIQRSGDSYLAIPGYSNYKDYGIYEDDKGKTWYKLHEGVNFIMKIHTFEWSVAEKSPKLAALIRKIPIVFFAAYKRSSLLKYTRYVRELDVDVSVCNDIRSLVSNVIARLSEACSKTTSYPTAKPPTSVSPIGEEEASE